MPAEGRENPLLKKGNSDAFFREKYLTKNTKDSRPGHFLLQVEWIDVPLGTFLELKGLNFDYPILL